MGLSFLLELSVRRLKAPPCAGPPSERGDTPREWCRRPSFDFLGHVVTSFSAAASRGSKKMRAVAGPPDQGRMTFWGGPERRSQNPEGGATEAEVPQSRKRAGVFRSSPRPRELGTQEKECNRGNQQGHQR
jgi:hypothetical protein